TLHMVRHMSRVSEEEQLPLYGVASCYSAIPLLSAAHCLTEPFKKLVLINAITALNPEAVISSFAAYYRKMARTKKSLRSVVAAIGYYADFLFPGIAKNKVYFGTLERKRARLWKTICEFLTLNPLVRVHLKGTPVLCLYARNDRILEIYNAGSSITYENAVGRVCPQTHFYPLDGDHFLSPPGAKSEAAGCIASFLGSP
ncbi:MAG: hypothetical protein Q8N82_01135, partial [Deltaproteobacteria bacterium]|nr:hypothetical protein [Deltaproteobacteria bacterium]